MKCVALRFPILVVLLCTRLTAWATAYTDPEQIQTDAFILVMEGDQAMDDGQWEEALSRYQQGQDLFRRLHQDFPDWNPRMVQYRLTYCENQIQQVRQSSTPVQPQRPQTQSQPVATPITMQAEPLLPSHEEVAHLQSRIIALEYEREKVDALSDEILRLQRENTALQTALSAKPAEPVPPPIPAGELEAKQTRIEELEQQLAEYEETHTTLEEVQADLTGEQLLNQRLHAEVEHLTLQLNVLSNRIRTLEATYTAPDTPKNANAAASRQPLATSTAHRYGLANSAAPVHLTQASAKGEAIPPPEGLDSVEYIRSFLHEGAAQNAYDAATAALNQNPQDKSLRLLQAIALIHLQNYSAAISLLTPLAQENQQNAAIHAALGAALLGARYVDEARDVFEQTIKLDKNNPEAHYNLAQIYAYFPPENIRKARLHYKQAQKLGFPENPRLTEKLQ